MLDLANSNMIHMTALGFDVTSSMFDERDNTLYTCFDHEIRVIQIDTGVSPVNITTPLNNGTNSTNSSGNGTNSTNGTTNSTGNTTNTTSGTNGTSNTTTNATSNATYDPLSDP